MRIGFARRARRDLEEIFDYIATDNPKAAQRVLRAILDAINLVATNPSMGIKSARGSNARSKLVISYPYRVHYLVRTDGIFIVHVRHTARRPWTGGDR
jgi:plasmid stabilization system protein ParE